MMYSNIYDSTPMDGEYGINNVNSTKENNVYKAIKMKRKIRRYLNSIIHKFLMAVFFLYIIFSECFRLWTTEESKDKIFFVLTSIAFVFFATDIILQQMSITEYMLSLNFILEILATLSILFDIGWIYGYFFTCSNCDSYKSISEAGYQQERH